MTRNVGSLDRGARIFLAIAAAVVGFSVGGVWAWVLGAVALILAGTAAVGTCPIYLATDTSTVMRGRARKRRR